ncbi:MAG: hypothetical protein K8W52_40140, partial [Deltaproteobacteria bacterium]|nr:hypothetical protein [Deltaproteobacteria bacterium]
GLRVPARAIATIDAAMTTADRNDELADLIARSQGENLGFALLAGARDATPADVAAIADDTAARVLWLDGLVVNVDRTAANPNVLVRGGEAWMIDHGAALPFQYAWAAVTEASPRRPTPARAPHLFADRAARMRAIDDALAAALPRAVLEAAAARVPDALLAALTTAPTADRLARMRAADVAFLWTRLTAPRPFVSA